MPSNHLILCCPLLLLPSIFPHIRVFSNESIFCIRWPNYWSISFSISPSNEYSGLISFRMDWLDLLAVQGTLKSLLQHHSSKASTLWCSAFFTVQLSHPYMTTGKTLSLTRGTFVGKVMSLLFNMLSKLIITFLLRIMASGPITSWQTEGEKVEVVTDFLFLGSKSLRIVTAAMKSEMFASWQESYDKPRQHAEKQRHYSADKSLYSQVYGLFSSS